MNFETYREVWEYKYKDDATKHQDQTVDNEFVQGMGDDNVFDIPFADFRVDLGLHKLVWTGDFKDDLWFYIKNEHPLLSCCLSPKEHPLGRWERFFIELFIFAFAAMWAASMWLYVDATEKEGDKWLNYTTYYAYSILGGVIKTGINFILKLAATCTKKQEESTRTREKWEVCGHLCMLIWGLVSIGLFGLGLYFVSIKGTWAPWVWSIFIQYVSGWCTSLIITIFMFIVFFIPCKDGKFDDCYGFKITYDDYERWPFKERNNSPSTSNMSEIHQLRSGAKKQHYTQQVDVDYDKPVDYVQPVDYNV